jgi:hypothetical protein
MPGGATSFTDDMHGGKVIDDPFTIRDPLVLR